MAELYKEIHGSTNGTMLSALFLAQKSVKLRNKTDQTMNVCTVIVNEDHIYHRLEIVYGDIADQTLFNYEYTIDSTRRPSEIGCANLEPGEFIELSCDETIAPGRTIQVIFAYKGA